MDSLDRTPERAPGSRPPEEDREPLQGPEGPFPWEAALSPPPPPDEFQLWDDTPAAPTPALPPEWWRRVEPPLPGGPIEEPDLESNLPDRDAPPLDQTPGPTLGTDPDLDLPPAPAPSDENRDRDVPALALLLQEMSPVPAALLHDLTGRSHVPRSGTDAPPAFAEDAVVEGEPYLVFHLAGAEYAVALCNVREIAQAPVITPLPRVPDWLLGVSNVRGDIVSVVDLRLFLGLPECGPQRAGRLLVVTSRRDATSTGLRIDAVREIVRLPAATVTAGAVEPRVQLFLQGLAHRAGRLLRVLDLERFLRCPELRQFEPV